jgi:hypothetical protein
MHSILTCYSAVVTLLPLPRSAGPMKSLIPEGFQRSLCMQDTMRAERETTRQRGSQDHTDDPRQDAVDSGGV